MWGAMKNQYYFWKFQWKWSQECTYLEKTAAAADDDWTLDSVRHALQNRRKSVDILLENSATTKPGNRSSAFLAAIRARPISLSLSLTHTHTITPTQIGLT